MLCPTRQKVRLLPVAHPQHRVSRNQPWPPPSGLACGSACLHRRQAMAARVCLACELEDLNMGFQCLTAHLQVILTCQNYLTLPSLNVLIFNMGKINIPNLKVTEKIKRNEAWALSPSRQTSKLVFFLLFSPLPSFFNFFFISFSFVISFSSCSRGCIRFTRGREAKTRDRGLPVNYSELK